MVRRPLLSQEDPFCPSSEGKVEIYLLHSVANLGQLLKKAVSLEHLYCEIYFYFPNIICEYIFERNTSINKFNNMSIGVCF